MESHCVKAIINNRGTAIFAAMMLLVLATGLGLLAFHVSSGELQISAYGERELASTYLAEAGVEKILSWVSDPTQSPNPTFFARLSGGRCSGDKDSPDFQLSDALMNDPTGGPFSELGSRERWLTFVSSNPLIRMEFVQFKVRQPSEKGRKRF